MSNGFWTDFNTEPKRGYRFILLIGGIPQWLVKKVNKPEMELGETEHQYINHTFYYPGRMKWNTVSATLVDPVTPDASLTMVNIIRNSGYSFPTSPNDVTTVSKKRAVQSLGRVEIQQIGPDDETPIERWILENAWVRKVNFGDLDYSEENMVDISLDIRYDFARIETTGQAAVGHELGI